MPRKAWPQAFGRSFANAKCMYTHGKCALTVNIRTDYVFMSSFNNIMP